MENNYFEKQVQVKMADLKIQPSPENWAEIESRIRKRKINKRFLWLFLTGVCLLAGGTYLLYHHKEKPVQQGTQFSLDTIQNHSTKEEGNQPVKPPVKEEFKVKAPDESLRVPDFVIINRKPGGLIVSGSKDKQVPSFPTLLKNPIPLAQKSFKKSEPVDQPEHNAKHMVVMIDPGSKPLLKISKQPEQSVNSLQGDKLKNETLLSEKGNYEPQEEVFEKADAEAGEELKSKIQDSVNNSKVNNKIGSPSRVKVTFSKRKWKWGFTFSGGKASSGNGIKFAWLEDNKYFDLNSPVNSVSPGYALSRPASIIISKPKSSVGFKTGLWVKKDIVPNISMVGGLNYTYYSNTLQINTQSSFLNRTDSSGKNQYRNNFHFLELPVSLEFQVNKNKKLPLQASAGATFSRLLISDAVEPKNGYYLRDGSLLNKTQVGITAGFSATFYKKVSFGPYINYSLSKIADQGVFENKHWNFIGLKLDYLLIK